MSNNEIKFKPTDFGEPFKPEELEKISSSFVKEPKLTPQQVGELLKEVEQTPSCSNCGAASSGWCAFCGACGVQNANFSLKEFQREFGTNNLEDIQKQEGCSTGHLSAKSGETKLNCQFLYLLRKGSLK